MEVERGGVCGVVGADAGGARLKRVMEGGGEGCGESGGEGE